MWFVVVEVQHPNGSGDVAYTIEVPSWSPRRVAASCLGLLSWLKASFFLHHPEAVLSMPIRLTMRHPQVMRGILWFP